MGVINSVDINALFTAAKAKLLDVYRGYTPDFVGAFQDIPSSAMREGYIVAAASGGLERLSDAKQRMGELFARVLYVENREPWVKFLEVSEQQIELQAAVNWLSQQAVALGTEAAGLTDDLIVTGLQTGASTAWVDGKTFFATDHPVCPWGAVSGTWSNLRTTFPLTTTNFETAWADLAGRLGWNGRPLKLRGQLELWVPTAYVSTAKRIVEQQLSSDPGVSTAGGNTNINFGRAKVRHCPSLDDEPTTWYLVAASEAVKPIGIQEWRPVRFDDQFNPDSDSRFEDERFRSKVSRGAEVVMLNAHQITRCEA